MDLLAFIVYIVIVTASGALAPGPLFFVVISHGAKSGAKGGLAFSVAHSIIEFPLVILLALGLLTVADEPIIRLLTGVAGGLVLLVFGAMQIRDCLSSKSGAPSGGGGGLSAKNPLFLGLIFTGLNPYFIVWWLFVGGKLILDALAFASLAGVTIMYVSHVWMDYAWLTAVAYFAKMGTTVMGTRGYKVLMMVFGAVLICFGLLFLTSIL